MEGGDRHGEDRTTRRSLDPRHRAACRLSERQGAPPVAPCSAPHHTNARPVQTESELAIIPVPTRGEAQPIHTQENETQRP